MLHLARGEGRERYFGYNLMQRKVLASFHQHLMAEAPIEGTARTNDEIMQAWYRQTGGRLIKFGARG